MHDLHTIQKMNREATERANEEARAQREARLAAITESVTEADEVEAARKAAMRRHPAGKRLTEPAPDAARCAHCGDIIQTADDNMAEHVAEYHSARAIANDAMAAFTLIDAEDYEGETEPEEADVAEQSWGFIRDQIEAAIENDRAQRSAEPSITTHDSRCTLDRYHEGECNVSEWRG